jgi:hypothetical protein
VPALFTVLVGDDPGRRLATFEGSDRGRGYSVNYGSAGWWCRSERLVHDVQPFIPEGTPVDRIVVLPEIGEAEQDKDGWLWLVDGVEILGSFPASQRSWADDDLRRAARRLAVAAAQERHAAVIAARAAEPTPDPLAQARERLVNSVDLDNEALSGAAQEFVAALAATEGGGDRG